MCSEKKSLAFREAFLLFLNVRKQSHETRALDRSLDFALLLRCEITLATAHDAAVRIDELLQKVDVFVIDVSDVILCENVVCHTF